MSVYEEMYNLSYFYIQNDGELCEKQCVFGIFDGKDKETFFCIIFHGKICVKIIPKLEKSTTQVKNMCYNIVG